MSQPFDLDAWANNSNEQGQPAPPVPGEQDAFDPTAWAAETFVAPEPEPVAPPVEEKKSVGFVDILKLGAKQASALNPIVAYATRGQTGEEGESLAGTIGRGLASAGISVGQAGSALGTTLPATIAQSRGLQGLRDLSKNQISGALEGTPWQPAPPVADPANPINKAVNAIPGELTRIGKENAEEYKRWSGDVQAAVPAYRRGKDFIDDPSLLFNPHYLLEGGISAAGSMVPPLLVAMTGGGAAAAGVVGGAMEGLPFLQDMVDKGVMPDEALLRSGSYAAASAALNAFSFGKMLDVGVNDALKVVGAKILASAGWEGFTEWLEGPVQALAEHVGTLPLVAADSTMLEDAGAGLGKAFKAEDPRSLTEAVTKAGREEAAVIPGAILSGGGISMISQLAAPEKGAPPVIPPQPTAPVPPPPANAPVDLLAFAFDMPKPEEEPATSTQQLINQQTGISMEPARPAGYYDQPIIGQDQIQEFEQGLNMQTGPTELLGPDDTLTPEWQARQADQDAMNEQTRLATEWQGKQQAPAPVAPPMQGIDLEAGRRNQETEWDAKDKQQKAVTAWQTALDEMPADDEVGRAKAEWSLREAQAGRPVSMPRALPNEDLAAEWQARIDARANQAATSPLNDRPQPTAAQAAAGNYKKGPIRIQGMEISVENPAGSVRKGTDEDGKAWEIEMKNHYGYIKGTKGADKEHLDTFVGPNPSAPQVFVIDQINPKTGEFDEHKVMIGFDNAKDASAAYLANYEPGWKGLGAISGMPVDRFKEWSKKPRLTKKPVVKGVSGTNYSTTSDTPGVTTPQVRAAFPKALVKETADGWEVNHGGTKIRVAKVGEIQIDEAAFEKTYGRKRTEDERALGSFAVVKGDAIISLTGGAGDSTLRHETWHAAERMALTPKDVDVVAKEHGGSEARANAYAEWLGKREAKAPVQKIFQKIFDFFSRIKALFHKNANDVFREVSTGRAFEKSAKVKDAKAQYHSGSEEVVEDRKWAKHEPPRTKDGKIKGAPEWVQNDKDLAKMRREMRKFVREGLVGRMWYENSAESVLKMVKGDVALAEKFIQLLAIYSPNSNVWVNSIQAVRAFSHWARKAPKNSFSVGSPDGDGKATSVLYDGKPWAGRKTNSFYLNLMYDLVQKHPEEVAKLDVDNDLITAITQPATIDVWMARAFGYRVEQFGNDKGTGQYSFAENEVRRITAQLNLERKPGTPRWTPHQVQASVWTAIKTRYEVQEVKDKTNALSQKQGIIHKKMNDKGKLEWVYPKNAEDRRRHLANWRHFATQVTSDQVAAEAEIRARSFGDDLHRMTNVVTWEANPSTAFGYAINNASAEVLQNFTAEARALLMDEHGNDILAAYLGVPLSYSANGFGAYAGAVSPNNLSHLLPARKKGQEGFSTEEARLYTRAIQYIFKQDAVPWFRPENKILESADAKKKQMFRVINSATGKLALKGRFETQAEAEAFLKEKGPGFEIRGGDLARAAVLQYNKTLESADLERVLSTLRSYLGDDAGFTRTASDEITIINFRDDETKLPFVQDEDFLDAVDSFVADHGTDLGITENKRIWTEGEYGKVHDWSQDKEGSEIIAGGGEGSLGRRPDLLPWLRDRRAAFDALIEQYNREVGEGGVQYNVASDGQRLRHRGPQIFGGVDAETVKSSYGDPQKGSESVLGYRYGKSVRSTLSGKFNGQGIKGAEAKRLALSSDPRIKSRIYFYVNTGRGVRPEPGLGANIHAVNLHNLYNALEDPLGLVKAAYADRMKDNGQKANDMESAILDAGFDGYWNPEAQSNNGVAVLLGDHTAVPVDLVQGAPQYQTSAFYSAVERAIVAVDFKAMPAADLANRIRKIPGIKAEELEDLGLIEWLEGIGKEKVTKDQAVEFVRDGGPKIEEVQKGTSYEADDREAAYNEALEQLSRADAYDDHAVEVMDAWLADPNQDNTLEAEQLFIDAGLEWDGLFGGTVADRWSQGSTKFSQYQMPGGENYREVLLTLPPTDLNPQREDLTRRMREAAKAGDDAGFDRLSAEKSSLIDAPTYRSPHWSEANVLAHVRLNDRKGPNGERILFIEEIQSDLHQEGRKKGYAVTQKPYTIRDNYSRGTWDVVDHEGNRVDSYPSQAEAQAAVAASSVPTQGVPSAPFKKSWAMLAFKRVLRMAAEQGYDSVAWTPGEVQAERYDLSKHVESVNAEKTKKGDWKLEILPHGGGRMDTQFVAEKDLEATIGKELAEKVTERGGGMFSGLDLKIGGEGMKGFYDRILPAEIGKYAKKWGVKVSTTSIPVSGGKPTEYADSADYMAKKDTGTKEVWTLPITDVMREDIMKGQPLYQEPSKTPSLVDVKEAFSWADSVEEDGDGRVVVTAGMNSFAVTKVDQITPDEVAFKIQYKRAFDPRTDQIAGDYKEGEIRLSKVADKWTLMHEYFHALEDMGVVSKMEQGLLNTAAKKGGYNLAPSENRAYYIQDQLESRNFDRKTPLGRLLQKIADYIDAFANLFTRTTRGVVRDVESGKMMARDGEAVEAQDAMYALISPRVRAATKTKLDYLRMKFQDKFIPLLRVQEKLVEDGWVKTDEADAYRAEERFSGKAGARLEKFQKNKVGRLLEAIKTAGLTLADVEDYLYAKYAPQRNAYIASINPAMPDGGSGRTNQWAADKLNDFQQQGKTQRLEAVARIVRSINQMQRDIIRNEGLEEDDTIDAWEAVNPDYVPLKGGKEETRRTIGTGFNIKGSGTKRAMGRRSPATDILAHMFAQVGDTIIRAEKAKVGRAFLKMVEENSTSDLWRLHDKLPTKRTVVKGVVKNVVDLSFPRKDNVLTITLDDASIKYVEIFDDDLARVMKNLTPGQHGNVTQAMATFTRFLSMVNTSLNLEFVLTNLERDLMTAMINLSGEKSTTVAAKVLKSIPAAMGGIYNNLRGDGTKEWAIWYDRFKDAGGHISFMDLRGVEQIKADIEAMVSNASDGALAKGKKAIQKLLKFIGDLNTTVENAVRLATFRILIEAGVSESDAASAAKNLTVNFNRKGELGPAMNALYMFFNAGMQGSARILSALGNPRVQKIVAGVTLLAFGLAELNVLMGGDDDDDEKKWDKHASDWTKQTNLIFMLPDGDSLKIKMPYGYNFFVALGYTLSDVRRWGAGKGGKNPAEAATFLLKAAMNAFNPMGDDSFLQMLAPTVLDPFLQIATNENFMGTKIAPTQPPWGPPKPNSQLAFRSVSKPSKAFAEYVNSLTGGDKWNSGSIDISPEWIDHIQDFLTGGLGRMARDVFSLPATLSDPDLAVQRVPFLRHMYQQKNTRIDMERFYDNVQAIGTAKAMFDEAPIGDREGFKTKHPELKLWKPSEGIKNRFSDLRKQMFALEDKGDKAGAKVIEEEMRKKATEFNKKFNEVKRGVGR